MKLEIITPILLPYQPHSSSPYFCQTLYNYFDIENNVYYVFPHNILVEFIGVMCVIKLYRFKGYNSIIYHLYIYFIVFTIPSHISFYNHLFSLYCLLPPHPYFPLVMTILWSMRFYFIILFYLCLILHLYHLVSLPLLSNSSQCVLCICEAVSILLIWFIRFHI